MCRRAGLLCDILWSDPDKDANGWSENDRGVSYTFGPDVVAKFLQKNDFDLIVRAHQVVEDGYEFFAGRQLVTVFSAPNYCGEFDNCGAMMSVDENLMCSFQVLKPVDKKVRTAAAARAARPAAPLLLTRPPATRVRPRVLGCAASLRRLEARDAAACTQVKVRTLCAPGA